MNIIGFLVLFGLITAGAYWFITHVELRADSKPKKEKSK